MKKLKIEYLNIEELIPYINNPRTNDNAVDKVAASIKEFGFKNPIIIDNENVIVAGHTRLLAAKKLELKEVPTIKVEDLTENQIKAFRIADNKTSEFAEWDMELLEMELEDIDIDMEQFGMMETPKEEVTIEEKEITPFIKVHYLITADLNQNDLMQEYLEEIKKLGGVEIESSLN